MSEDIAVPVSPVSPGFSAGKRRVRNDVNSGPLGLPFYTPTRERRPARNRVSCPSRLVASQLALGLVVFVVGGWVVSSAHAEPNTERGDQVEAWYQGRWRAGEVHVVYRGTRRVRIRFKIDGKQVMATRPADWVRRPGSVRGEAAKRPPNTPIGVRPGEPFEVRWQGEWVDAELIDYDGSFYMGRFKDRGKMREWRFASSQVRRPAGATPGKPQTPTEPPATKADTPSELGPSTLPQAKSARKYQIGDRVRAKMIRGEKVPAVVVASDERTGFYTVKYLKDDQVARIQRSADWIEPRTEAAPIDDLVAEAKLARLEPLSPMPKLDVQPVRVPGEPGRTVHIDRKGAPVWHMQPDALRLQKSTPKPITLRMPRRPDRLFIPDRANALIGIVYGTGSRLSPQTLEVVSVPLGRVLVNRTIPKGWDVLDVSPCATRALLSAGFSSDELAVLDLRDEAAKMMKFEPFPKARISVRPDLAEFVGPHHIIAGRLREGVSLFDAGDGRVLYHVSNEHASVQWHATVGDGRWLLGTFLGELLILDTHAGEVAARRRGLGLLEVHAALSEDGRQLVLIDRDHTYDLDATTGDSRSPAAMHRFGSFARVDLVDKRFVLVNGVALFDVEKQAAWWRYEVADPFAQQRAAALRVVLAGRLWYVATGDGAGLPTLKSIALPDEAARQAKVPADMLALEAGDALAIEVDVDAPAAEIANVRDALGKLARRSGFRVTDRSDVRLVIKTSEAAEESVTYLVPKGGRRMGGQEVKTRSKRTTLTVEYRGKTLWKTIRSVDAPHQIHLEPGQDLGKALEKAMPYDLDFFDGLKLPAQFIDPRYANGLGRTMLK